MENKQVKHNTSTINRYTEEAFLDLSTIKNPMSFTQVDLNFIKCIQSFGIWRLNDEGYVVCTTRKICQEFGHPTTMLLHRYIYSNVLKRKLATNEEIDHINLDRLDNRVENLRICSHSDNCKNKSMWKKSPGKFKGTRYVSKRKVWQAQISIEGRNFYIGTFKTEKAAAVAYNHKADAIRKQFANLNPISDWEKYDYEKHRIRRKKLVNKFKKINSF